MHSALIIDIIYIGEVIEITLRWYFFCSDCLTRPVYIPHIHQPNNRPSHMRNVVLGSIIPCSAAVAATTARPPSTKMAWQMHGPVQGVSSLSCSTLRPNKMHGQRRPVQPIVEKKILNLGFLSFQMYVRYSY